MGRRAVRAVAAVGAWTAWAANAASGGVLDPFQVTVPLYGDVDKLGYVYAKVTLEEREGAPVDESGQPTHRGSTFRVILDTGSKLTYLPCTGCTMDSCGERRMSRLVNRAHETTELVCRDTMCPEPGKDCSAMDFGKPDTCFFKERFAGGSKLSGEYVTARMNVSTYQSWFAIGCAEEMSQVFQEQFADGSLGMGPGAGLLHIHANAWSVCLAPAGFFGGNMTIGRDLDFGSGGDWVKAHGAHESDHDHGSFWEGAYRIGFDEEAPLRFGPKQAASAHHMHGRVNTGSPLSWVPTSLFTKARAALLSACDDPSQDAPKGCAGNRRVTGDPQSVGCFSLAGTDLFQKRPNVTSSAEAVDILAVQELLDAEFPELVFALPQVGADAAGKAPFQLVVKPKEYMFHMKGSPGTVCVGIMEDASVTADDIVLGVNLLRGWRLDFALEKGELRFSACDSDFDLAKQRMDEEEASEGASGPRDDKSSQARAAVVSFLFTFVLSLSALCCCRCLCTRGSVKYSALENFGSGDGHATRVEMSGLNSNGAGRNMSQHFSIASMTDDDDLSLPPVYNSDDGDAGSEGSVGSGSSDEYIAEARAGSHLRTDNGQAKRKEGGRLGAGDDVDAVVRSAQDLLGSSDSDSDSD